MDEPAAPAGKAHSGKTWYWLWSALLVAGVLGLVVVIRRQPACPFEVVLVGMQRLEIVDESGADMWAVTFDVSNRSSARLRLHATDQRSWARVGGRWVDAVTVREAQSLLGVGATSKVMVLVPGPSESCRFTLKYETELLKWRMWRRIGPRGQRMALRFPKFCNWLWPAGSFGERPPNGWPARNPPDWRQASTDLALPHR